MFRETSRATPVARSTTYTSSFVVVSSGSRMAFHLMAVWRPSGVTSKATGRVAAQAPGSLAAEVIPPKVNRPARREVHRLHHVPHDQEVRRGRPAIGEAALEGRSVALARGADHPNAYGPGGRAVLYVPSLPVVTVNRGLGSLPTTANRALPGS